MVLKSDRKEQLNPVQFYQDEVISVSGAERIISVIASARVTKVEPENGEIRVGYRLNYKVIYKGAEIDCLEETADRQTVIRQAGVTPKSVVCVDAQVISTEYVGTTSLKVRLNIELSGYVISERDWECVDSNEGWQVKNSAVSVEHITPVNEKEIVAEHDFELKEGLGRILTYNTQVSIKSVRAANEISEVDGECYTYITYLNDQNLLSRCLTVPFHTEILVEEIKEDSLVYLSGVANSTTITLPDGEGSTNVRLEVVVGLKGYAINRALCDVVCDAYSTTKELKCNYAELTVDDSLCLTGIRDRLSGSVRLEEDQPRVRSVLCVCPPAVGAVTVTKNDDIMVEGIVSCDILYLDEQDGVGKILAEIPYRVQVTEEFACTEQLSARVMAYNLSARARHNDEIEVNGEITVELFGASFRTVRAVASAEEGAEKECSDVAISLYLVRSGEDLWDVAKAMSTDEDTLMRLNPDVELPLKGGEKILLYRPIED